MRVYYTKKQARKVLLALLALIIILSIAALFTRLSIVKKLELITAFSKNIETDQSKPEHVLILLYQAEEDFQESLLYSNRKKSNDYKTKMNEAFQEISALLREKSEPTNTGNTKDSIVNQWYKEKLALSDKLHSLKQNFDSLLVMNENYVDQGEDSTHSKDSKFTLGNHDSNDNSDTVRLGKKKKGLVKRIKDAIINKDGNSSGYTEIRHYRNSREKYQELQKIDSRNKALYTKKLMQLQSQNETLQGVQSKLIGLNTYIINEMSNIIVDIKDLNYKATDDLKKTTIKAYEDTTKILNRLFLTATVLVLAFAILLIVFIFQLNNSEVQLHQEINKLDNVTLQLKNSNKGLERTILLKNKLISIISHDLIGSIYSLNNTLKFVSREDFELSHLKSVLFEISTSSDQLAIYSDDIITWIQFQQHDENMRVKESKFDLNELIKEKWKVLALRASMKKVTLNLLIKEHCYVTTDQKIMGIIIYNILSNAIKFTEGGKVTVCKKVENNQLVLHFADNGIGFSETLITNYNTKNIDFINPAAGTQNELGKGIGLIIVRDLAKQINAEVLIGNNAEGGAFVTINFPGSTIQDPPDELNSETAKG